MLRCACALAGMWVSKNKELYNQIFFDFDTSDFLQVHHKNYTVLFRT
jgi:hypothetical protein